EGVDVGGDDVAALVEVDLLHVVQDLFPQLCAGRGGGLAVELAVGGVGEVGLVEGRCGQHRQGGLGEVGQIVVVVLGEGPVQVLAGGEEGAGIDVLEPDGDPGGFGLLGQDG